MRCGNFLDATEGPDNPIQLNINVANFKDVSYGRALAIIDGYFSVVPCIGFNDKLNIRYLIMLVMPIYTPNCEVWIAEFSESLNHWIFECKWHSWGLLGSRSCIYTFMVMLGFKFGACSCEGIYVVSYWNCNIYIYILSGSSYCVTVSLCACTCGYLYVCECVCACVYMFACQNVLKIYEVLQINKGEHKEIHTIHAMLTA